jgi:periplasmic divalent cation tolerance protein
MTAFRWVYVTCQNGAEARKIADLVVKKRLAACANWFPVRSIYWWRGKMERASETALVLKTTAGKVKPLIAAIKAAHSYEVPCIEALPILDGNPDYLKWIREETREE